MAISGAVPQPLPACVELNREEVQRRPPQAGASVGREEACPQVGQERGTSHGTSAAPYQAPSVWEPWSPTASARSYFPFPPCTHLLAASCLGLARMKLEAELGSWAGALSHY